MEENKDKRTAKEKKADEAFMKEWDKPDSYKGAKEYVEELKKKKKGITTKNSPMKKPWGFLCKD